MLRIVSLPHTCYIFSRHIAACLRPYSPALPKRCAAFHAEGSAARYAGRWLHGFEQTGYIAAYDLPGCVFKRKGGSACLSYAWPSFRP